LLGRYFHFRLYPFSIGELLRERPLDLKELDQIIADPLVLKKTVENLRKNKKSYSELFQKLWSFSGFPEPYLAEDEAISRLWRRGRREKILREDLIDLSRVQEIKQVDLLCTLLEEKVGSPLSIQSLREDCEVAHTTVSRWLLYLKELYYFFDITPYSKSISRSLKKEPKIYFYDWTEVSDEANRLENMVALHLWKMCHFYEDSGEGIFSLHYLRNKEKKEVDFLVLKNKKPWFTVEVKLNNKNLDGNFHQYYPVLKCPHFQVIGSVDHFDSKSPQEFKAHSHPVVIISAHYFLSFFP
jgi:predicted AAA+ superfamily ATPase